MGNRKIKGQVYGKCSICKQTGYVELHHIIPISLGGLDENENLIYLCSDCHNIIHKLGVYNKSRIKNMIKNGIVHDLYIEYCTKNNICNSYVIQYGLEQIEFGDFIIDLLKENTNRSCLIKNGLDIAKAKGKTLGRPKVKLPENFIKEYRKFKNGEYGNMTASGFAKMIGIGRSTLYKYIKIYEENKKKGGLNEQKQKE